MDQRKKSRIHSMQERLHVMELHRQGLGSKQISERTGIDDSLIRLWLRKYRAGGQEALEPYRRGDGSAKSGSGVRVSRRDLDESRFEGAFSAYASTLEPVASIARRYRLDYHSFLYHVQRYHPEFKEQRERLRQILWP